MRRAARILVVEDDPGVVAALTALLGEHGYEVEAVGGGRAALARLEDGGVDACVLDVVLPDLSGLEVLRAARPRHLLPVLLLTARSGSGDKVLGLDAGADDYVVKPFDPPELLARLRALLRRAGKLEQEVLALGACLLDTATHTLRRGERRVDLTALEERLLETLASVPGKVWTRSQLLDVVWEGELEVGDRSVDSAVRRLRRKIESLADPDEPAPGGLAIRTLYGLGYRLDGVRW